MFDELRKCPFCGADATCHPVEVLYGYGKDTNWWVGCSNGRCRVKPGAYFMQREDAIAWWQGRCNQNNRTDYSNHS